MMNSGILFTLAADLAQAPVYEAPDLLGIPIKERLHPRGRWHGQQGRNPHCMAYTWLHWWAAHSGADEPFTKPRKFYRLTREIAGRNGGRGATLLEGRMAMGNRCSAFVRLPTLDEVRLALLASGPVLVASTWTAGMMGERMAARGEVLGAHGYLLDGYEDGRARVKNSLSRQVQWLDLDELGRVTWEAWLPLPATH